MLAVDSVDELREKFTLLNTHKVKIVLVVMLNDCYATVKFASDSSGMLTQCVKWAKVDRVPRGLHFNIALKLNTKLGGTNNTLVSRSAAPSGGVYQDPPASLSWILDKPCMFVGMDVTHSPKGSARPSLAAIVASMDGRMSQFAANLSCQSGENLEMIEGLEAGMTNLLNTYKTRNQG